MARRRTRGLSLELVDGRELMMVEMGGGDKEYFRGYVHGNWGLQFGIK